MNLFDISAEIRSLFEQVDDDGMITEEAMQKLLELEDTKENRKEYLALFIKEKRAEGKALKEEADNLYKRSGTAYNEAKRVEGYLSSFMQSEGCTKFQTPRCVVSFRASTGVVIDEGAELPKYYYIEQPPKLSKEGLREDLKNGVEIVGARLETRFNLQVK